MARNPFAERIAAQAPDQPPGSRALAILDEFCHGVREGTEGRVRCWLERGFITGLGQEWRVMFASANDGPEQIMLRAHVPVGDFPVLLDVYAEELVKCSDEDALRSALGDFLDEPVTRDNLALLARQ